MCLVTCPTCPCQATVQHAIVRPTVQGMQASGVSLHPQSTCEHRIHVAKELEEEC